MCLSDPDPAVSMDSVILDSSFFRKYACTQGYYVALDATGPNDFDKQLNFRITVRSIPSLDCNAISPWTCG